MKDNGMEVINTRVAHAGWDDHRYFGYSVFNELAGHETYTGLIGLTVHGRRISSEQVRILDDIAGAFAVAEPRIYALKIVRLISSFGRILPACASGILYMEDAIIGPWTSKYAAENLVELDNLIGSNLDDNEYVTKRTIEFLEKKKRLKGYGVPFRSSDERIRAIRKCIERRERHTRRVWRLFEAVSDVLRKERGLEPNVSTALAAVYLDLGFTSDEIPVIATALSHNLLLANAIEEAKQKSPALQRLPEDSILYVGKARRKSPRAVAAGQDKGS